MLVMSRGRRGKDFGGVMNALNDGWFATRNGNMRYQARMNADWRSGGACRLRLFAKTNARMNYSITARYFKRASM